MNLKTPGREDSTDKVHLHTKADYEKSKTQGNTTPSDNAQPVNHDLNERIIAGLGGRENIEEVDNCATRLRVTVVAGDKVNQALLKETGAAGVFIKGSSVQVVYGLNVGHIKTELTEYMNSM